MRTIKFRGKEAYGTKWIYGYLTQEEDNDEFYIRDVGEQISVSVEVEPETIGQFTRSI